MSGLAELWYCIVLLLAANVIPLGSATHITGTFRPNEFFKFIVKFGFQKTERHSQRDSFGYIYGNITSRDTFAHNVTFAVLDKYSFLEYYGNRTVYNKELACQRMFDRLEHVAFNKKCAKTGTDFLRTIPCPVGRLCVDEDSPANVVPGNQFTYVISDLVQPRFWYVSMVACYRNETTCQWHHYDYQKHQNGSTMHVPEINYDFWLVNGNPNQSASNPFTFHFSFEEQNLLEMYLIFFVVYLVLVPMQIYAVRIQKHPVTKLFTISLVLELISLLFILTYMVKFAVNGVGNEKFKFTGDIIDIFSMSSFMLILLLLAKGWAVTRQQISRTGWMILMTIWIPYCAFHIMLYVWDQTEVDIISDIGEYQTWPGWIVLSCRSTIMMWFLWELRNTMKYEHSSKKLDFLLHFGASSLVWFIYLPIVAIVALQVSPMWRYKLLLGITNSADCLAYCVMTGLLWPNRAGQYLLLAGNNLAAMDELDEFNEAPHIVHGDIVTTPPLLDAEPTHALSSQPMSGVTHIEEEEDIPQRRLHHPYINGEVSTDLLDGDDVMLIAEDLLMHHHNSRRGGNSDVVTNSLDLDRNGRVIA